MNWGLFESFCEMLEGIPIKAVLRAADAERKMMEEDLKKKRMEPSECALSVLGFCNFLTLGVQRIHISLPVLPFEHRAFYRYIVHQLVDAGELPAEVERDFEKIFSMNRERQEWPQLEYAYVNNSLN